jgi:ribosomal protein S18 acetylase RimI-like enzyme
MREDDQVRFGPVPGPIAGTVIRPLRTTDAGALGELYEATPREDFRFYCPHDLNRAKAAENAAAAPHPDQVVLVLETPDKKIGGYAWYRWEPPDAASSMFGILIGREYQGRGVGKALMARLLEIAKDVGPPVMWLTVQLANPRAVGLYQKMGFRIVRKQVRKAYPEWGIESEPEYYMERAVR